jgi:hypothetical protein
METEAEMNAKILKVTMVIRENYPEVTVKHLKKYYESLVAIFRNYVAEHQLNYYNQRNQEGHL